MTLLFGNDDGLLYIIRMRKELNETGSRNKKEKIHRIIIIIIIHARPCIYILKDPGIVCGLKISRPI